MQFNFSDPSKLVDDRIEHQIDFAFDRITKTPNSVNSHRLIRLAETAGNAGEVVEALFTAFFLNGLDIGEPDVLMDVGRSCGLDADTLSDYLVSDQDADDIHDQNAHAHRLGINGVPSYVFNDRMVISGAQEPQVLARLLDAAEAAA